MLTVGDEVGPYHVQSTIAHGGMSTVYRVIDSRDDTLWALKVLTLEQPGMHERFRGEAAIQASVDHPNIVAAREIVELEDHLGIVMEWVDGPSLDLWLRRNATATFEVRHALARQIVVAVAAAHRAGMVHRDLKPANVLIASPSDEDLPAWLVPQGPGSGPADPMIGVAKVTDFGLAKQQGRPALTRTGIALGTPRYMAPEQFRDAKRVDHRADVFALGALLYELYSGRPAFERDSIVDAFEALADGNYVDPAVFGVPEAPCIAIRAALEADPDKRLPDCDTFLEILDGGAWDPRSIEADPEPIADTVPPSSPRLRVGLFVAMAVLGLVFAAGVGGVGIVAAVVAGDLLLGEEATPQAPPPPGDPPRKQPRRSKRR